MQFRGIRFRPTARFRILLLCMLTTASQAVPPPFPRPAQTAPFTGITDQTYYANAHPYLADPPEQLLKRVPDLKGLQPDSDQQQLPDILEKTGAKVDEFFRNVTDVAAHEFITEEQQDSRRNVRKQLQVEDNYLIVREGSEFLGSVAEIRLDAKGNTVDEIGLHKGYFDTSNVALNQTYLATAHQSESKFLYLGEQELDSQNTYVVAFAQKPGAASITMEMEGPDTPNAHRLSKMLVQGVAWISRNSFQIVRLRTDLLAPRPEIHLDSLSTTVSFSQVQISDVSCSFWLPSAVQVYAQFTEPDLFDGPSYHLFFRNEHHFSKYQSYRVSVKMLNDIAKPVDAPAYRLPIEESDQTYYANARPYLKESVIEITKQVPELKKIQLASDQSPLPEILKRTSANVDDFFHNMVDLVAHEEIVQERLNNIGGIAARELVRDNYLILRHGNEFRSDVDEYRMDAKGNRMDEIGLEKGFLVTFGFALNSNYFSAAFVPESKFRYLGEQKLASHDTYVVAFAQQPGLANIFVTFSGPGGKKVRMLMQGIAWIDKSNFQIIRMRTDLLAPHPEISLDRQSTEVSFSPVQLPDVAAPLWLPNEVKVALKFRSYGGQRKQFYELNFRNEHHYSDYHRYRVSVKMITP